MLRRKPRPELLPTRTGGGARRALRVLLPAVLFVLSGLTAWLVLAGREGGEQERSAAAAPRPARASAGPELRFHDFVFPETPGEAPGIYPWRAQMPRWDDEQIARYWIPLDEITLDVLEAENDARVEKFFAEVP